MEYRFLTSEQIVKWCIDNKETAWLKEFAAEREDGSRPTFFEIKKAFAAKFMPEILPKAKEKKLTIYDIIDNL